MLPSFWTAGLEGAPSRQPASVSKGCAEPRSSAPCHRQSLLLPRMGILTHFPFAVRGVTPTRNVICPTFRKRPSPVGLGPPDPRPIAVPWEPFSMLQASRVSLEYLLLPPRSALVPVPRALTLHASTLCLPNSMRPVTAPPSLKGMIWSTTPSYSWIYFDSRKEKVSDPWRGLSGLLERHPFSGLVHSARKLLHTSWRIPTSMATAVLSI